jgi:predicted N-formylglutamate amidohydrolase
MKLVISCEHGGNEIPKEFQKYFVNQTAVLQSHRGYDPGTLDLFEAVKSVSDFSESNTISRLLIECNRSLHHPKLFSEFTKNISETEKEKLISTIYLPYRHRVENRIRNFILNGETVLHISIHSFTPELKGKKRNNDIGLLYDSQRNPEKAVSKKLKSIIIKEMPSLKVRYNYPYLGKADGFTTYLRKQFSINYIGIELEVNQKWVKNNLLQEAIKTTLVKSLKK